ncbi:DUF732 domain-containing protein [Rhodococcus sp. WS4]|nr:DUF732 domain-containing protein [Rhodococcus sp. WS4]
MPACSSPVRRSATGRRSVCRRPADGMKNDMDAAGPSDYRQHHHNAQDAQYLDAVEAIGIYPDEEDAVQAGKDSCAAIRKAGHYRREFNVDVIAKASPDMEKLTRSQVGDWHDLIVDTYCPEVRTYPY